mmetsp:Transcript_30991/g.75801  ORF Transcript_30991/g.75801 Transcript_30991/m.75801 type:complete len:290 (-) Transcript_30991:431-1300(-)|eukprot:CAMPEP_0198336430 /NCGR_PEP_ID=MMETSP1450-20131203/20991_1 /TAXON_ID=753684 ORGANISM="Madagascaria erythrocladiodes, Strain CCMP3234" /NCGR_SAMPLE_ID=MMETSP1450 /ASSEMBLY_ACC=CAM_ASM_001115 /LENGTH=289 /DNA_ID=CAMNT_0044041169 /DNA_START=44 /DNA_END=913 /DNA_ORIENTATION=-
MPSHDRTPKMQKGDFDPNDKSAYRVTIPNGQVTPAAAAAALESYFRDNDYKRSSGPPSATTTYTRTVKGPFKEIKHIFTVHVYANKSDDTTVVTLSRKDSFLPISNNEFTKHKRALPSAIFSHINNTPPFFCSSPISSTSPSPVGAGGPQNPNKPKLVGAASFRTRRSSSQLCSRLSLDLDMGAECPWEAPDYPIEAAVPRIQAAARHARAGLSVPIPPNMSIPITWAGEVGTVPLRVTPPNASQPWAYYNPHAFSPGEKPWTVLLGTTESRSFDTSALKKIAAEDCPF